MQAILLTGASYTADGGKLYCRRGQAILQTGASYTADASELSAAGKDSGSCGCNPLSYEGVCCCCLWLLLLLLLFVVVGVGVVVMLITAHWCCRNSSLVALWLTDDRWLVSACLKTATTAATSTLPCSNYLPAATHASPTARNVFLVLIITFPVHPPTFISNSLPVF